MTDSKTRTKKAGRGDAKADVQGRDLKPEDYVIYHDSIGVTHFLPPKRSDKRDA
ncbi:MAG: hypothetical protein ABSF83_09970 [Nitrososphaerales archaeon]|jgi:hypothetical protein